MDRSSRHLLIITLVTVAIFAALNNVVRRVPLGDWWSTIILLLLALLLWALGRPRRREAVEETPIEPIIYERLAPAIAAPAYHPPPVDVLIPAPAPLKEKVVEPLREPVAEKSVEPPAPVVEPVTPRPEGEGTGVRVAPSGPDDLKVVEGIGPKMEKALHAAGIKTFAQLAKATETEIHAAIEAAGMRFAPSVPTWAEQAVYAEKGDWAGLEAFQKTLTAGRRARK